MGTGKTTVGIRLAEMLNMEFVDTDDIIEEDSNMSITDIVSKMGGEHFRHLESKAVEKACKLSNHIIFTGGGVVMRDKNIQNLKRTGLIFCLYATPEVIWQRVSHETHRPLLQVEDSMGRIREMMETRKPLYDKADYKIDTSQLTIEQVAEKIVELFSKSYIPIIIFCNI